jgi:hypothetical protein
MVTQPYPAYRPRFQQQGPASRCVIDGKHLGWLSCSAYGMAMLIDRATLGSERPSGCAVRSKTGDTVGGLTIPQVANAALSWGVTVERRVGTNTASPAYAWQQLYNGRAFVLQGNSGAMVNTDYQSTGGPVNHLLTAIDGRNYRLVNGILRPDQVLVYDPAADGRYPWVDQGPTWWPVGLVMEFAAELRPWGDNDPRRLGPGKFYSAFARDTEPYVLLRHGAKRTSPFPDRVRADRADGRLINVYDRPDHKNGRRVATLEPDELWLAWQVTTSGQVYRDSRKWYGNRTGTQWIHEYRLRREGGST